MILVQNNSPKVLNDENSAPRTRLTVPVANSQTIYWGAFFDPSNTSGGGAIDFAANGPIKATVIDVEVYTNGGWVSVAELVDKNATTQYDGTFTNLSTTENAKYVSASDNMSKTFPDRLVYEAINDSDRIEATFADGTTIVDRGTTTGSDVIGNYFEPEATYNWLIDESTVNAAATGLSLQLVELPQYDRTKGIFKLINFDGSVS